MEESNDKVYMWLTIFTFIGFAAVITFAYMRILDYQDVNYVITENIFP